MLGVNSTEKGGVFLLWSVLACDIGDVLCSVGIWPWYQLSKSLNAGWARNVMAQEAKGRWHCQITDSLLLHTDHFIIHCHGPSRALN